MRDLIADLRSGGDPDHEMFEQEDEGEEETESEEDEEFSEAAETVN